MRHITGTFILMIIVLLFIPACNNKNNDTATIKIKSNTQLSAKVTVSQSNMFDQVIIVESETDSTGYCSFEVSLQKPMFVLFQIGEKYGEVYLSPGYDLYIEEVMQNYKTTLRFSGKGADVNNYVSWVNSNVESIKWANNKGLSELDLDEFSHRYDSLKNTINNFHKNYIDSIPLTNEIEAKLEYKNKIKFLEVAQEFKFYKSNYILNEKWEAKKNGTDYMGVKVSYEIEDLKNEIPFDPTLLTDGYSDYHILLNMYWYNNIQLKVSEDLLLSNASGDLIPIMTNTLIKNGEYPETIREFLIAFDLKYWLLSFGITPETDSVFADFKRTYQKSNYLPAITKSYNEWLAIAPGKPAPELEGYTMEGNKVSINDLKGKVIYMDVWATWCSPCIAQIPASKKLQQEFAEEENVVFLNVSVDSRKSDWEKFLNKDKAWTGLHIIIEEDKLQSLYSGYKLFGVPAYILIDQSGNIVNMKAPQPSDENIQEEIRQVLAKVF